MNTNFNKNKEKQQQQKVRRNQNIARELWEKNRILKFEE